MSLFYSPGISQGNDSLDAEEARHAIKVLRLQKGDPLLITDGLGKIYNTTITEINKSSCRFAIGHITEIPKSKYQIHIAIAPTKNIDRIEWFAEKTTELGIHEISFISCKNSERKVVNLERIQKKVISAMKQSGQAWLPVLHPIKSFEKLLRDKGLNYIAHVDPLNTVQLKQAERNGDYLVMIGPEGDFSPEELQLAMDKSFQKVSLGTTTLRTETAGIAACHTLNLINQ